MPNLVDLFQKHVLIWHRRTHYPYQERIARAIIEGIQAAERGESVEIPIELPRQAGKTTSIVDVSEFLLACFRHYFGRALPIGIFAPQREQATTDFDRLKMQYQEIQPLGFTTKSLADGDAKFPGKWNSQTIRLFNGNKFCGEAYIFPLSKTSNPESKTLGLIIIEEAQQVDDKKMQNSVFPMGASTNAVRIYIGTAGTRLCYFKKQLDTNPRAIRIKLEDIFADRRKVYEQTGDPMHLRYEQFVQNEIMQNGEDSDYIKTQYKNVWVIGTGQFCTSEQLEELVEEDRSIIFKSDKPVYVGIDSAKSPDQTVVTVLEDIDTNHTKSRILCWLTFKGDNYEDQFEAIKGWLAPVWEDVLDDNGKPKKNRKGEVERRLVAGFSDVRAIGLDATGQGDFMPDKFERHTSYNIVRIKFSLESKDVMYKNLLQVIHNKATSIPDEPNHKDVITFKTELLNLEKEYKGRYMSVHHPDDANAHDDYPDSWAIAEFVKTEAIKSEPGIRIL